MRRRELLQLAPNVLLLALLGPQACSWPRARAAGAGLFFDPEDIPVIRRNARSPLLRPAFERWRGYSEAESRAVLRRPLETGDLVSDLGAAFRRMEELSIVHLVEGEDTTAALLDEGIETALALPKWDWFLDGDAEIGIMRASQAVGSLLLALEVLGERVASGRRQLVHAAIAEKGAEPCHRAIRGMDDPESVTGWRPDEAHRERYPYDMRRWPQIFGGINLRAVPTMGLGLGGLALDDPRAAEWLDRAVASAGTYLRRHEEDGSYWEGISYVNYAFSTLFVFLEAYDRLKGDVSWLEFANFGGINRYVAAMQLGRQPESGQPDVVNFSDARTSTSVAVNAWLAAHTGDPLAQHNTEQFSHAAGYFADFLWYRPGRPASPPPSALKNVRLDLDWIIARTGWGENDAMLAFRSGSPANHEHADRNSFLYKIHGERLLTDQFGASYDPRLPHWLLRLTEAHNAVLVDGAGHQYVDGSEGTNAGDARAQILRYEDRGETLWWVSDATHGYRLIRPGLELVRRSMLFIKPDWILIVDELQTDGARARLAARFFPDNRDLKAALSAAGSTFTIGRPRASLVGQAASGVPLAVREGALDIPETYGVFPFVEVRTDAAPRVELVTVLHAIRPGETDREARIDRRTPEWIVTVPGRTITIAREDGLPTFIY